MFYYKKLDGEGNAVGIRVISCEQIESAVLVAIDEADVQAVREEIEASRPPDSYVVLRRKAYPPWQDSADALVKQQSSDPAIVAEGQAQEMQYYSDCLQVKIDYPKP